MGTWTSHMIAPASDLIPIPREAKENLTDVMGSTLMINPATAICMLREFEQLKKGDVIVQNAANSAVGQAVVQLAARVLGVETINFVRDRPDLQSLRSDFEEWGRGGPGTHVFTYEALSSRETSSETKDAVKRIANGRPIKLALNALCGKDTTNMSKLLAPSASLVTYGAMSRSPLSLPASLLIFRDLKARGFWMTTWYAMHTRQQRAALTAELARWYAEAILAPPKANIITLTHDQQSGEAQGQGWGKKGAGKKGALSKRAKYGGQAGKEEGGGTLNPPLMEARVEGQGAKVSRSGGAKTDSKFAL
ncbi:NAD(P)-binding protein [Ceraceosorus guamensis]|uniref:NAD(P)-binding protein n=1 Tax=Ceraceosorus guamensis TaxID=1522189 RepID=A0A316VPY1_9BASI|nr:NAD(P)-binding protein [Ceraceosorus guamensis]PWN39637.1 NAD(P)-binding protein [Ceraceosorus guamensis]